MSWIKSCNKTLAKTYPPQIYICMAVFQISTLRPLQHSRNAVPQLVESSFDLKVSIQKSGLTDSVKL